MIKGGDLGAGYVIRGDARTLPLADESVDLIVTSPPYFSLRSYRDSGEHFEGQIGSEAHPQEWLENLWVVMRECWRVLKPEGSCFVNLGDKRTRSEGRNNASISRWHTAPLVGNTPGATHLAKRAENVEQFRATRRNAPDRYNQAAFGRPKSKMLLPHRFAIGCEDGLADPEGIGWIVRQDVVWQKLNGLPESVADRTRDSHEFIFHLTKSERYYSAVDEIREPHNDKNKPDGPQGRDGASAWGFVPKPKDGIARSTLNRHTPPAEGYNSLGKLPGSVWPMASEPLLIPEWAKERYRLPDHFAAFPTELPRRIILGWSPSGICVECGEGRRPVVEKRLTNVTQSERHKGGPRKDMHDDGIRLTGLGAGVHGLTEATILGYACACTPYTNHLSGWTPPTSRPSVVLDPFGGTGTTALVARALGRTGISVDLSADYGRLARWRIFESGAGKKAEQRTWAERQGGLL